MTFAEELQELYSEKENYGKLMQVWYRPTERSRKWRKASLSVVLNEHNFQIVNDLKKQEGWFSAMWYEVGENPNNVNFKW